MSDVTEKMLMYFTVTNPSKKIIIWKHKWIGRYPFNLDMQPVHFLTKYETFTNYNKQ